jgi:hypothetical protein
MFGENAIDICCYSEAVDMSASYAAHASSVLGVGNKSRQRDETGRTVLQGALEGLGGMMLGVLMLLEVVRVLERATTRDAPRMHVDTVLLQRIVAAVMGTTQTAPMMLLRVRPVGFQGCAVVQSNIALGAKWMNSVVMRIECEFRSEESLAASAIRMEVGVMIMECFGGRKRIDAWLALVPIMHIYQMIDEIFILLEIVIACGA